MFNTDKYTIYKVLSKRRLNNNRSIMARLDAHQLSTYITTSYIEVQCYFHAVPAVMYPAFVSMMGNLFLRDGNVNR